MKRPPCSRGRAGQRSPCPGLPKLPPPSEGQKQRCACESCRTRSCPATTSSGKSSRAALMHPRSRSCSFQHHNAVLKRCSTSCAACWSCNTFYHLRRHVRACAMCGVRRGIVCMVILKQDIRSLCCVQPDELHEAREPPGRKANAAKEPLSIKVDTHAENDQVIS